MIKLRKVKEVKKELQDFHEFLKYKKLEPFKSYRQKAKAFNFGLIFGAKPSTIVKNIIELEWTEEEADKYIAENNLQDLYHSLKEKNPDKEDKYVKFLTCAYKVRDLFFSSYPKLLQRIDNQSEHARHHGYIRSYHGCCRRLPELKLGKGQQDDGSLFSNWENISVNTDIQNFETVIMHRALLKFQEWVKKENVRAKIFTVIHDAVELYVHRDDIEKTAKKLKEIMEEPYPEYQGIPIEVEGNVAYYWEKGQYWDMGEPISSFFISQENK